MNRLVRFVFSSAPCWGVVDGEQVHVLRGNPWAEWARGEPAGPLGSLHLLPPVTPGKILCVGRNYPAHAAEHGADIPAEPLFFLKPPSALIGPDEAIVLPPQSQQVEHEAELAVVIGRRCRGVSPREAWSHVLGITCANDITARDLQQRDGQWTRAKGFDTFCPVGPWLVTGLTEEGAADLAVICRVNGEVRQSGRTSEMVFSPSRLIAEAAAVMTLEPGDLLLTGTPAGVGPLRPGDVVEVEVEGVGLLRNPVRAGYE
jgi:2-keto-4-pentenoate hydratase/2-oxohepta-3-ene-1,7-dioic acid hydratase in catechol pathway